MKNKEQEVQEKPKFSTMGELERYMNPILDGLETRIAAIRKKIDALKKNPNETPSMKTTDEDPPSLITIVCESTNPMYSTQRPTICVV